MTDDEKLLPARDLARSRFRKSSTSRAMSRSGRLAQSQDFAVDAISKTMDDAWRKSCGEMTLRDHRRRRSQAARCAVSLNQRLPPAEDK
jgi:hypothetical protein